MTEAFQAKDIMTSELKIVMVDAKGNDERGVDIGGVYPASGRNLMIHPLLGKE